MDKYLLNRHMSDMSECIKYTFRPIFSKINSQTRRLIAQGGTNLLDIYLLLVWAGSSHTGSCPVSHNNPPIPT